MEPPDLASEGTSLARVRGAIAERDREIGAGRWLACGTLILVGSSFAAVAGIVGAVVGQRAGFGQVGHRVTIVTTIVVLSLVTIVLGRGSRSPRGEPAAGSWARSPARALVRTLRAGARRRARPSATVLREAAGLLDVAGDPSAVGRRIVAGGSAAMQALELLGALDLLRDRSLRRAASRRLLAGRPGAVPDPAPARGTVEGPRERAGSRQVHGLRERWTWSDGTGRVELHAAGMAGWVLVQDESHLTSLAPDGSRRWSRPAGRDVAAVHVACDGERVAVLGDRGIVTVLAGDTGERLAQLAGRDAATAVAIAAGGARVWIGDRFGILQIFDGRGRLLRELDVNHPIDFVGMASEVEIGVVASRRGHLSSVDPARGEIRRAFLRSDLTRVWVEEDGERALVVVPTDGILAWDFSVGSLDTCALDRTVRDAASDAPGDRLAALTYDDRLVLLDGAARVLWQCDVPAGSQRVRMSGDGSLVWCAGSSGNVRQLEVLDRADAERPALDLSSEASAAVEVGEASLLTEPEPGGFRRVLLDPSGRSAVLLHPEGRVAIQRDPRNTWLVTGAAGARPGDALIAADGSALGFAVDGGVRRVSLDDGSTRDIALPSPRLERIPGTGDLVAATPGGEVWRVGAERDARLAIGLVDLADLVTSAADGGSWRAWWSGRDGTVSRLDPGTGVSAVVVSRGELTPPVRLVVTAARLLLVDAAGALRWLGLDGREIARASLSIPIVGAERAGDRTVALTDFLGNVHLAQADGGVTGTIPRVEGIVRAGADASGNAWLIRVHRRLLLCQAWDGSIRARARVAGTPLDLASGSSGAWALLTTAGLFTHGLISPASNERARYLEL